MIKEILTSIKRKPRRNTLPPRTNIPWSIYGTDTNPEEILKKFNNYHYKTKYKVFIPIIYLANKLLKNTEEPTIENHWYNKNAKILRNTINETYKAWNEDFKGRTTNVSNILKQIKNFILKTYLLDTAYRELINIFMFKIANNMHAAYKGKHRHLMYKSLDAIDIEYYILGSQINNRTLIKVNEPNKGVYELETRKQEERRKESLKPLSKN